MKIIVASITTAKSGELQQALKLAKDASTKERNLLRMQEQSGLADNHNMDITFSVSVPFSQ